MPISQIPSQYVDAQTIGNIPGVRGGAIGTLAKIAAKGAYRGSRWFLRKFLKPNQYTYRGAVARGTLIGTGLTGILKEEGNLDNVAPPEIPGSRPFKQGNLRRSFHSGSRRNYDRCRVCRQYKRLCRGHRNMPYRSQNKGRFY